MQVDGFGFLLLGCNLSKPSTLASSGFIDVHVARYLSKIKDSTVISF